MNGQGDTGLNILQRYIKGDKDIHNRATVFVGIFNEYIQEFEKNENSVSYSIYYGEVINCTTFEQYTKLCAYHGVASYVGKQRGFARFREHDSNRETNEDLRKLYIDCYEAGKPALYYPGKIAISSVHSRIREYCKIAASGLDNLCNKVNNFKFPADFPIANEEDKQILGCVFLFQEFKSFKNEKDLSENLQDIRSFDYHGKEQQEKKTQIVLRIPISREMLADWKQRYGATGFNLKQLADGSIITSPLNVKSNEPDKKRSKKG